MYEEFGSFRFGINGKGTGWGFSLDLGYVPPD